jgi:hypothetical protein
LVSTSSHGNHNGLGSSGAYHPGKHRGSAGGPSVQKYSSFTQRCGWIISDGYAGGTSALRSISRIERSVLNDSTSGNSTARRNAIDNTRVQAEKVRTERLEALAWKYLVEGKSATRSGDGSGRIEESCFMDRLAKILKWFGHGSRR